MRLCCNLCQLRSSRSIPSTSLPNPQQQSLPSSTGTACRTAIDAPVELDILFLGGGLERYYVPYKSPPQKEKELLPDDVAVLLLLV